MELSLNDKIEYVENLLMTIRRNIFQYTMVIEQHTQKEEAGTVTKDHATNMARFQSTLNFNKDEEVFYMKKLEELKSQVISD